MLESPKGYGKERFALERCILKGMTACPVKGRAYEAYAKSCPILCREQGWYRDKIRPLRFSKSREGLFV